MVEIGAPQSKSAPESKLSYPADPSTDTGMYVVGLGLHNPSPTPFYQKKLLVLRETGLKHAGTLCKGFMEAWWW